MRMWRVLLRLRMRLLRFRTGILLRRLAVRFRLINGSALDFARRLHFPWLWLHARARLLGHVLTCALLGFLTRTLLGLEALLLLLLLFHDRLALTFLLDGRLRRDVARRLLHGGLRGRVMGRLLYLGLSRQVMRRLLYFARWRRVVRCLLHLLCRLSRREMRHLRQGGDAWVWRGLRLRGFRPARERPS